MIAVALAAVVAVILFFVLAIFAKGGAGEPVSVRRNQIPLGAGPLPRRVQDWLTAGGFRIEHVETTVTGETDIVATDARPLLGQRLYLRMYPDNVVVGATEVQAALDRIKEGFNKGVLIARGGFSDEALSAAADSPIELLDDGALGPVSAEPRPSLPLRPQEA